MLDLDRQEPLVGRPHMQTPRGLDPSGDASDWTRIDERLEVAGPVCDSKWMRARTITSRGL